MDGRTDIPWANFYWYTFSNSIRFFLNSSSLILFSSSLLFIQNPVCYSYIYNRIVCIFLSVLLHVSIEDYHFLSFCRKPCTIISGFQSFLVATSPNADDKLMVLTYYMLFTTFYNQNWLRYSKLALASSYDLLFSLGLVEHETLIQRPPTTPPGTFRPLLGIVGSWNLGWRISK